ncbi:MAG: hypothetical protein AB7V36_01680 [Bacteroidales bacterium]|jgi:hypothetical protein
MNTGALIMLLITVSAVTAITAYFFIKVLTSKPKQEPDSYCENDDEPR